MAFAMIVAGYFGVRRLAPASTVRPTRQNHPEPLAAFSHEEQAK